MAASLVISRFGGFSSPFSRRGSRTFLPQYYRKTSLHSLVAVTRTSNHNIICCGPICNRDIISKDGYRHRRWTTSGSSDDDHNAKWSARFVPPKQGPNFIWKPSQQANVNPATKSFSCSKLLVEDAFIDKSALLYYFLKDYYDDDINDFESVPILIAYPRRFAKTTLLGFIEAVFSPVSKLEVYESERVKKKIAALERGKELLELGCHPVLRLNLHKTSSIKALNLHIKLRLNRAGLDDFDVEDSVTPAGRVLLGARLLNQKFKAETGVNTQTIVLIDEYDKPFRERKRDIDDPLLTALIELFSLGKEEGSGISLLVLCGLTRMVGTGLSSLNNLVDVSRLNVYHGLCGISSKELVRCANGQLDDAARRTYNTTFADALDNIFRKQWNVFRFGIDDEVGLLDPMTSEGALFSPLDVWEIVQSLVKGGKTPSPIWIKTMHAEFQFTSFTAKYTSSRNGYFDLYRNLEGGWVDTFDENFKLTREAYMKLDSDEHVKVVLLELGLLSVQDVKDNWVRLVSPNEMVLKTALNMLLKVTKQGVTTKELAEEYLSENGFSNIVSTAAMKVSNWFGGTGGSAFQEYTFQLTLYRELLNRFLVKDDSKYMLYREKPVAKRREGGYGRVDLAVALHYKNFPKTAVLIEVKLEKITSGDEMSIRQAHQRNLKEGIDQVKNYDWLLPVDKIQRVAVSGVWHPRADDMENYTMNASLEFLAPTEPPSII